MPEEAAPTTPGEVKSGLRLLNPVLGAVIWWMEPDKNAGSAVYGLMTVGAVVSAESAYAFAPWREVLSVALVLFVYWGIHSYSTLLGRRYVEAAPLSLGNIVEEARFEWSVLRGGSIPLFAMAVAALLRVSSGAVSATGIIATIVALMAFELAAGLRARLSGWMLVLQLCVGAGFGLSLVLIRAILH